MGKNVDKEQPDPIVEALDKIVKIRAKALERDPDFFNTVAREQQEDERRIAIANPKPILKGAMAHQIHTEKLLGKDY